MLESVQLTSVNVGAVETISHGNKNQTTGIRKKPVSDPVCLEPHGIVDDAIVDLEHHGGVDQAIYAYRVEDYEWWAQSTNREYYPGLFGENLTIRGLGDDLNVGDRLLIGEVVLEATSPRIPCSTLAARMQDSGFGLLYRQAERPGIYFRVLNGGEVSTGDAVTYVPDERSDVSINELFRFYYNRDAPASDLSRFLSAPLAARIRAKVEARMEAIALNSR